jgi:hypothetical protein
MTRHLLANTQQASEVNRLVDQLGVGAYRDAKRDAGLAWYTPFRRLYRLEAETVIGILKQKLNQTKG